MSDDVISGVTKRFKKSAKDFSKDAMKTLLDNQIKKQLNVKPEKKEQSLGKAVENTLKKKK